jgi:cell fate (sporulation/competence/biofilm development) regulator YlbF (YheA/YmcA/DUF963 family)
LKDWRENDWLTEHTTSPQEIKELLGVADRDLKACETEGLGPDWQLAIAYNAALQLAVAALAASGYRASRESHHFRAIQSLKYTIELDSASIDLFDSFRKKRNIGGYERAGTVSEQEAKEIVTLAQKLRKDVEEWLRAYHPELFRE